MEIIFAAYIVVAVVGYGMYIYHNTGNRSH